MRSVNPANGKFIADYPEYTDAEVNKIISAVNEDAQRWKKTSFSDRGKLFQKASTLLRQKKKALASTISLEMGKPISESIAEIEKSAWVCDYYAEKAAALLADETIISDATKSFVSFEPIGIILSVMPWNFPYWQVFRFAAPALMAGNAAVLKHASNVQGCAAEIEGIFKEAGFPENLFRNLVIKSNQVKAVISNQHIKACTLTGSEYAGSQVAMASGREIKKTVLELGGADAFIILKDADIVQATKTAVRARMLNNGQSCIAAKRFIIDQSIFAEFVELLNKEIDKLKLGDPMDVNTQIGPLAREDLRVEVQMQVETAIAEGATLLRGGKAIEGDGFYFEPTIICDVKPNMKLYYEESFGPVFTVITFEKEEDAIRIANDSEFGLGGSLWCSDIRKAEKIARRIESGGVFINSMTKSDPRLPFGGIKKSGYGRELSHYGIKEFVNIKTIWIA